MRLERITAQAFRGYPNRVDVVLGGDVVLIYGENGTGKTSLTEAFEWCLYGTIVRKARSKSPGEYQGLSWVRSVHAPADLPTIVEVELRDPAGATHVVRRTLSGSGATLTINGKAAATVAVIGIPTEDAFRPFLGQCEIQGLIDSEQKDRWAQLSAILGFGAFGQLRARLQRLRTDTDHDARVKHARELAIRAVQPLTPAGEDPLAIDPEELRVRAATFLNLDPDVGWGLIVDTADLLLQDLYAKDRRPEGLANLIVGSVDITPAAARVAELVETVASETVAHRSWHRAHAKSEFARQGLALAPAGAECPFCGKPTLSEVRRRDLSEIAAAAPSRPPDSRPALNQQVALLTAPGPLGPDVATIMTALEGTDEHARLTELAAEAEKLGHLRTRLAGLVDGLLARTDLRDGDATEDDLQALASEIAATAGSVAEAFGRLRVALEALNVDLTSRFTTLDDGERDRLGRLQRARLLAENARWVTSAWRVRQLQEGVAVLIARLEEAEKAKMAQALQKLSADIARYYEELSPGHHISIKGVSVRDTRHRQAALEATSFGKEVNPVTMFSEAEGNALGLSLYFSQRVDRNPSWFMIMLDDPVQSMDEGHEQGLIHLLARISRDQQVIVFTHDRDFQGFVQSQFEAVPSFTRYNVVRSGTPQPRIEIAAGRLDELLDYACSNADGDAALRESCAGALRKGVERFTKDLASRHGEVISKKTKLEDAIDRLHSLKYVDDIDRGTLQRIRKFGNPASHDDASMNVTAPAIRTNVRAIRELQTKYLTDQRAQLRLVLSEQPDSA